MDKTVDTGAAPFLEVAHAEPNAILSVREGGEMLLESGYALGECESNIVNYLRYWAAEAPDRVWLAQRPKGGGGEGDWETVTYGDALAQVNGVSQALLDRGLDQSTPVVILSGNSIEHALLVFGAMQVGVPAAPIAEAYSLMAGARKKLDHVFSILEPRMIFAQEGTKFEETLASLDLARIEVVCLGGPPSGIAATAFSDMTATPVTEAVEAAYAKTGADTVGKYLFTSGSTGMPKAVAQTQRMMCANQRASSILMPADAENPPVIVDWLPWNHCYGGSSNTHGLLREGGTMYIDEGRPVPGLFDETVRNLREIAPTKYLNVAAGHAMLVHELEQDADLRKHFFSQLTTLAYGGASLPEEIWRRYQDLAVRETGKRILFYTGWGSTETAPVASSLHWPYEGTGNIGHPLPGITLKLVPNGDKLEVRVKGDHVCTGYYRQPDKTAEAFDEEGFYKIGDAVKLLDPDDAQAGLVFDGRVVEDFKLLSGTFVSVGTLRNNINSACAPAIADCIVAGHDRDYVSILAWPDIAGCRTVAGRGGDATPEELIYDEKVIAHITSCLRQHNADSPGSSTRVRRVHLMAEPPSQDAGEITEKGYVNQRATLDRRADLVKQLYADSPVEDVIEI